MPRSSSCCAITRTPILRAAGLVAAERAGRHHQRQVVQRLRHGCAPHLRQFTGALMQATTPNQLIGVFAHETGHIVGGHLSKMRQELANAQTAAIVAMLLGVGAMAAGAQVRQRRHGQCRRGRDQCAAVLPAAHAAGLPARPGGTGRPRRRPLSDHDRPVGQGHVRHLQALRRRDDVLGGLYRSLRAEPPDARGAHGRAGRSS